MLKSYGIVVQDLRCARTGNDLLVRCHPLRIYTNSRKFQPLCRKYGVAGWLFSRCFFSSCIQIFKVSLGLSGQIAEFSEGLIISNDKNSFLILEYLRKLRWFRNQRWITLRPWFAKIFHFGFELRIAEICNSCRISVIAVKMINFLDTGIIRPVLYSTCRM